MEHLLASLQPGTMDLIHTGLLALAANELNILADEFCTHVRCNTRANLAIHYGHSYWYLTCLRRPRIRWAAHAIRRVGPTVRGVRILPIWHGASDLRRHVLLKVRCLQAMNLKESYNALRWSIVRTCWGLAPAGITIMCRTAGAFAMAAATSADAIGKPSCTTRVRSDRIEVPMPNIKTFAMQPQIAIPKTF
jgi:hypothetical protein